MTGKIKLLEPDIGDKAVDHRGAIFSYVPKDAIVEFVYVYSKPTGVRGKHYHKHFDEYIMMVDGEGIYFEPLSDGTERKIIVGSGQTIYIPKNTPHTFYPLVTCKAVSLLTAKWNDFEDPITPFKK
tara:strand:- start:472 stop:849 length:378 start_codon:yes stop_codon:yes gene_type:complete